MRYFRLHESGFAKRLLASFSFTCSLLTGYALSTEEAKARVVNSAEHLVDNSGTISSPLAGLIEMTQHVEMTAKLICQ